MYTTTMDMDPTNFKVFDIESDDVAGPFGAHGIGEPCVTNDSAIINAIFNATGKWMDCAAAAHTGYRTESAWQGDSPLACFPGKGGNGKMYKVAHVNAKTVQEATAALAKGKAMVIAGGTDVVPFLKGMFSPTVPDTMVNLKTIPGLDYIKEEGGMLKVGALANLTAVANNATVKTNYTALAEAARDVAAPELRNMGTIGGNICQSLRCAYYRNEYNDFPCLRKIQGQLCFALAG